MQEVVNAVVVLLAKEHEACNVNLQLFKVLRSTVENNLNRPHLKYIKPVCSPEVFQHYYI